MKTKKDQLWKLKYHCDNCSHNWAKQSDCMIEEDSCPICNVLTRPEHQEYIGDDDV